SRRALQPTGFRDPGGARHNLRLIVEGRPLVPYEAALGRAMERLLPNLLDAVWQSPDPDEALNQMERFLAAVGPRAGLIELLASDTSVLAGRAALCAGRHLMA